MLQELTQIESAVYRIFRSYKSFARMDELKRELKITEEEAKEFFKILESKGYLSANKLGHYKETVQAQKARLNGKTSAQYVAEGQARQRAQEAQAWMETFGRK